VDTTGHAHTIITAADGIVGSTDKVTMIGTANTSVRLRAYNGLWYVEDLAGGSLSEV
jgi:hypothetical protein